METPSKQHSYMDIFGDRLPSRFPVPRTVPSGPTKTSSITTARASETFRIPFRKRVRYFFTNVWDSRISMKLFGSRKELELEAERLQTIDYIVIHPCSKFR